MEHAYALIVGIAHYQNISPLPDTVLNDAEAFYQLLTNPAYCGYHPDNVQRLLDGQATRTNWLQALSHLAQCSHPDSTVFIYVSGHGGFQEFGSHAGAYLLPVDADLATGASLAQTAISGSQLTEALRAIPARRLVVVFDCCHAGGIGQPKDATAPVVKAGLPDRYYDLLKQGQGRVILASSRSTEQSYVLPGASNSLFTPHLLAGLQGQRSPLVARVTADFPNQHPILKAEIEENFAIALYLGGKSATPLPAAAPDTCEYDVLISYWAKDTDKTWVRKTLLPALERAGLRVCLDLKLPLGVPLITSMERAVQQSRYTLAILSPEYLNSSFAEFESLIA